MFISSQPANKLPLTTIEQMLGGRGREKCSGGVGYYINCISGSGWPRRAVAVVVVVVVVRVVAVVCWWWKMRVQQYGRRRED